MNFDHGALCSKGVGVTRTKFGRRNQTGATQWPLNVDSGRLLGVESRRGAVALGRACLFPPLSSGGALVAQP
jgi:hypothetical protein